MADERNMYGCLPCPKCGSKYRWPQNRHGTLYEICDGCSYIVAANADHPLLKEMDDDA